MNWELTELKMETRKRQNHIRKKNIKISPHPISVRKSLFLASIPFPPSFPKFSAESHTASYVYEDKFNITSPLLKPPCEIPA